MACTCGVCAEWACVRECVRIVVRRRRRRSGVGETSTWRADRDANAYSEVQSRARRLLCRVSTGVRPCRVWWRTIIILSSIHRRKPKFRRGRYSTQTLRKRGTSYGHVPCGPGFGYTDRDGEKYDTTSRYIIIYPIKLRLTKTRIRNLAVIDEAVTESK